MSAKSLILLLVMSLSVSLAACKSEVDNKPAAEVAEVAAPAENAEEAAAPETREIVFDTENSKIGWVGAKVTGDHTGGFNTWTGKATVDASNVLQGVEFEVDTTSVFSDNDQLTGHLKSDDFFDVENHPTAKFVSTKIAEGSDVEGASHTVTGNMTLRGITKEISFPATLKVEAGKLHASSEFTLNRFDFEIKYAGMADDLIKPEVLMKLDFVAPLAAAEVAAEVVADDNAED